MLCKQGKIIARHTFAKGIRCVVPGSIQPSQQKLRIVMQLFRKSLWRTLVWWLGPPWIAGETNKVFKNFVPTKALSAHTERDWHKTEWRQLTYKVEWWMYRLALPGVQVDRAATPAGPEKEASNCPGLFWL